MPTPQQIEQALKKVRDQRSFLCELLAGGLEWPVPDELESLGDISYDWSESELRADGLTRHLTDGRISQIQPLRGDQPWSVFLLEFKHPDAFVSGRGLTGPLRKILRGLLPKRRRDSKLRAFQRENLLFVCTHGYQYYRFAYFKAPTDGAKTAPLATFGWGPDEPARTACEFNLPDLVWPDKGISAGDWTARWAAAFDVERVTKRFYEEYAATFARVEKLIGKHSDLDKDDLRMFTQTLFNRLMFLRFVERKGWLEFQGRRDYLRALQEAGPIGKESLYRSRMRPLFFEGLAVEGHKDSDAIGHVPFLNGGLFEMSDLDKKVKDIPDEAFSQIIALDGLFYRFNFTVEESTPLDIEVAVDPEMLGKVFEGLVTGRRESGSYYTPRPVVSFMCREALKGYLANETKAPPEGVATLVDEQEIVGLNESHGAQILDALDSLKAVDPACGSGAYLLGLLQELIAVRRTLQSEKLALDPKFLYDLKLRIISHNLYGVDIDPFATNIAMLRLWLSLAVEANEALPLPNLDFKIETGDSVTGPDPGAMPDLFRERLQRRADLLTALKDKYLNEHATSKHAAFRAIRREEQAIAEGLHSVVGPGIIDWRIHFAEVFGKQGGFDIVLANPPYVRQELIDKAMKENLLVHFGVVAEGKSDLYVYFYARGLELLRDGGMHVFICSNSWLDVAYGGKLQKYLLQNAYVRAIYDSAVERQFATADINTVVTILSKGRARESAATHFVMLRAPFEKAIADQTLRRDISRTRASLWEAGLGDADANGKRTFEGDKWGGKYLRSPDVYWRVLDHAGSRLVPLGQIADIRRGVTTGANDFFLVRAISSIGGVATVCCDDRSEHTIEAEYVQQPVVAKAREIIKPYLAVGDLSYRLVSLDGASRKKEHAGRFIAWGEASRKGKDGKEVGRFHLRPTTRTRRVWYVLEKRSSAHLFIPIGHKRRPVVGICPGAVASDNLVEVTLHDPEWINVVAASILSSYTMLVYEIIGRANFGQGLLKTQKYELAELPVLDPRAMSAGAKDALERAFCAIGTRAPLMIYDDVREEDRRSLDDAFLLAGGFAERSERAAISTELQEITCRMIWSRMAKADSSREHRQTFDDWAGSGEAFGKTEADE